MIGRVAMRWLTRFTKRTVIPGLQLSGQTTGMEEWGSKYFQKQPPVLGIQWLLKSGLTTEKQISKHSSRGLWQLPPMLYLSGATPENQVLFYSRCVQWD